MIISNLLYSIYYMLINITNCVKPIVSILFYTIYILSSLTSSHINHLKIKVVTIETSWINKLSKQTLYQLNMKRIIIKWLSMIILRILNEEQLNRFRKVEKSQTKLNNSKCHLDFNITCINNELLPIYTTKYLWKFKYGLTFKGIQMAKFFHNVFFSISYFEIKFHSINYNKYTLIYLN